MKMLREVYKSAVASGTEPEGSMGFPNEDVEPAPGTGADAI